MVPGFRGNIRPEKKPNAGFSGFWGKISHGAPFGKKGAKLGKKTTKKNPRKEPIYTGKTRGPKTGAFKNGEKGTQGPRNPGKKK